MKVLSIRVLLALVGNALGLWIASLVLDDMEISGAAFVLAVVIFSVLTFVLEPLIARAAERSMESLQGGSALITTAISLWLTDLISDGLSIKGIGTFLLATVIVWVATLLIGVVLARLVLRRFIRD